MLEVRNDLIAQETGQAVWAERLFQLLSSALETIHMPVGNGTKAVVR